MGAEKSLRECATILDMRILLLVALFGIFLLPPIVSADETATFESRSVAPADIAAGRTGVDGGLVPVQCRGSDPSTCGSCEFVQLVNNVIQFIIVITSSIAILVFIAAGFRLVTAGGNVSAAQKAREMLTNVAIGYVIILSAFLVIDLLFGILIDDNNSALNWRTVECVYPVRPTAGDPSATGGAPGVGTTGAAGSCVAAASGPCSADALRSRGWGDFSEDMAVIISAESGCNATAESGTDRLSGGGGYSIGTYQINLAAHKLQCDTPEGSLNLDCPSAFRNDGRSANGIRRYAVVEGKEALAAECRAKAAQYPSCNEQIAQRLARNSGDLGDWACSAKKCGIFTSRNDQCKLR